MATIDDKQTAGNFAEARWTGHAPTVVISGPTYVRVSDPQRGISTGTRGDDDTIEVALHDKATAGTPNEPWILKTLSQALTASGRRVFGMTVSKKNDKLDKNRIDGILFLDESRKMKVNVQVVTAPAEPTIWNAASKGPIDSTIPKETAADWIHLAIEKKQMISPDKRPGTILAIDVRHFGMLADGDVVSCYVQKYGDARLGFDSVWLVGPVVRRCRQLHDG